MATPQHEDGEAEEVPAQFECSICMKLLLDPVTVSCGHTFCRTCLEQSLGYRSVCAVCRSPVVAGQGVNILVRGIIAEQYPKTLALRLREVEEELQAGERHADEARRREARAGAAGDGPDGGSPVLPLMRGQPLVLPHCRTEVELCSSVEARSIEYALRGGRRLGIVDGMETYDDEARPMGVCVEVEHVERDQGPQQRMRVRLVGKFRFWLAEAPQAHEDGFELGRCEAFFDTPLAARELFAASAEAQQPAENGGEPTEEPPQETIAEVARAALELLEGQMVSVGLGGRHIFVSRHGEVPSVASLGTAGSVTSASMERLSFWLLGALVPEGDGRRRWLGSVDTRARLDYSRKRLAEANGKRLLDLPGARSWMNPGQSALQSFALLVLIIALFVAKAMGLFDKGRRVHHGNSQAMEDSFIGLQLLR